MIFHIPTKVYQKKDAVKVYSKEMAQFGKKALIVTGKSSSKKNGSLQDVKEGLEKNNTSYIIYDKIEENPTVESVMTAARCGIDEGVGFVIGIGGGSPMDASKAIALMIQNPDCSSDVLYKNVPLQKALPVICVPTTCGTGSEVTPYAILTRDDIQTKQSISHRIFPELALVDGKYLKEAPLSVITNTAIDALGHMIESYFNTNATDYSRMLCQYAMEVWGMATDLLFGTEPQDDDYNKLMFASSLAGMAISHTGTSLPHGLSYYLTYHKNIPHGKAVGLFLPGYLSVLPEGFEVQVIMALRALGFGSLEQFSGFIEEMLGKVDLSDEEMSEMIEEITGNEKKLWAVPFAIAKKEIEQIVLTIRN